MLKTEKLYSLRDISIIPEIITDIKSRSECNPFMPSIEGKPEFYPIIASPMDSVVSDWNYMEFWKNKISCIIPRTIPLEKRLELSKIVFCAFSIQEIKSYLQDMPGKYILIDIANGHMKEEIELGYILKEKYPDLVLMGGNIANPETYIEYNNAGFDFLRVGIGGGNSCLSSTQCAIHYPMASLINSINNIRAKIGGKTKIIADGGISSYSDIIKCLSLGSDYVMLGKLLAKSIEAAGSIYRKESGNKIGIRSENGDWYDKIEPGKDYYKEYHGMSTKEAQAKILGIKLTPETRKSLKTAEGNVQEIKIEYDLHGWIDNFNSYLRSGMSYCNSRTIDEFKEKSVCQVISDYSSSKINDK